MVKEIIPIDNHNLCLLVDYCKKTKATINGDSHQEIVLYLNESNKTYQIHTYETDGNKEEVHHAYEVDENCKFKVYALIEELKLEDYQNVKGNGLCGIEYVIKYRKDEKLIRISTNNVIEPKKLIQVGQLLYHMLNN